MTRPLRLEFAGALYHVTSRGDHSEAIYLCDEDRLDWLNVLKTVCARFNWVVHAYYAFPDACNIDVFKHHIGSFLPFSF